MKLLINALSGIGDALMFSPTLESLKTNCPDVQIDFLVMYKSVKELYENNPHINNIYYIDLIKQSKLKSIKEIFDLRKNIYDYAINIYPSNRFEYNLLNFLIGSKNRLSFRYIHSNILRFEFLNTHLIAEKKDIHNVLQNLEIVKLLCRNNDIEGSKMDIYFSEETDKLAKEWIDKNNLNNRLIVGIHAGSSTIKNHINKRWQNSKYSDLGKKLVSEFNAHILLFGNEVELNNEICKDIGIQCTVVNTKYFMDSVAIMKYCKIFVSNDTAFLHCASALSIPIVAIFGYTNFNELYPWKTKHIIVRKQLECSPCFYNSPKPASCFWKGTEKFKCMKTIEVNEVFDACELLIKEIPDYSKS